MNKSVFIIDCDGVLYPQAELGLAQIVAAMKKVYREDVGLTGEQQKQISEKSIRLKHFGAFNFIKHICDETGYCFDLYRQKMVKATDYSAIQYNPNLKKMLNRLVSQKKVFILSNNSYEHIDCVLQKVFHETADEISQRGVVIYDITATEKDGCFHPKQSEKGFTYFLQNIEAKGEDCFLFDDSLPNLQKAKQIGIEGSLVTSDNDLETQLRTLFEKNKIWEKNYGQTR